MVDTGAFNFVVFHGLTQGPCPIYRLYIARKGSNPMSDLCRPGSLPCWASSVGLSTQRGVSRPAGEGLHTPNVGPMSRPGGAARQGLVSSAQVSWDDRGDGSGLFQWWLLCTQAHLACGAADTTPSPLPPPSHPHTGL